MLKLSESPEFLEFLDSEFRRTSKIATVEELAEFAFGSIEKAVEAFKAVMPRGNNENRDNYKPGN